MIKLGLSGPKQLWRHKLWRSRLRKFSTGSKLGETCTPSDTVSDDTIAALAERSPHPLTLADLVRHGRPPLSQPALQRSANFSLGILPTRIAHRIRALRNLPFIVVTNPHVAQIHNNYMHSLSTLLPFAEKEIGTPEDEDRFVDLMAGLVQTHNNTIPVLARGFLECRRYMSGEATSRFLDEHLRARIGTRLIAEQHLALYHASKPYHVPDPAPPARPPPPSTYIGIIDTALQPSRVITACEDRVGELCELSYGVRPSLVLTGDPAARIAHVPVHLEYIMTELLKNAFRATVEAGNERHPVEVTIAPAPPEPDPLDPPAASTPDAASVPGGPDPVRDLLPAPSTPGITIRLRDRGGGISPANCANLWNYGFTTFNDREAAASSSSSSDGPSDALNVISGASATGGAGGTGSTLAGLGYGLPLARAYAEHFGGGIAVQSLWSWGTDVYLTLRGVGRAR